VTQVTNIFLSFKIYFLMDSPTNPLEPIKAIDFN